MEQEKYLDSLLNKYVDVISNDIPWQWIDNWGYSGSDMHAVLNQNNSAYEGGPYYYNDNLKFVHWTSLSSLMSIINSREIRFYNLNNSNDLAELRFAAEVMGVSDEQINHSKEHLYTFSFCEGSEINNDYLWENYGDKFSGCAIEFEIVNDPMEYKNFMLSKVYYELPNKLLNLINKIDELKKRFPGMNSELNLSPLISFHKKSEFKDEKEVRLSTFIPFRDIEERLTKTNNEIRTNDQGARVTNYFGLNLWVNNDSPSVWNGKSEHDRRLIVEENYFRNNPKIKINNIRLGYKSGVHPKEYFKFKQVIEFAVRDKLGYNISMPDRLAERLN